MNECEKISKFSGEIEIDESCFGGKRERCKKLSTCVWNAKYRW